MLLSCLYSLKISRFVILWTVFTWSAQSGIYCWEWLCVLCRPIVALSLFCENFDLSFYEGLFPSLLSHFMSRPELKRPIRDILSGVAVRILSLNSSNQLVFKNFWVVILWRSLSELAFSFYEPSRTEALNQGYTVGSGCAYCVAQ